MIVILDNGHGFDTPGKRSPVWDDGRQLFEWEFNRDIVDRIRVQLQYDGIPFKILVPEIEDIPLAERVLRANKYHTENRKSYLVSVHANAGGGTGWEVWTSPGQTKSDEIATVFFDEAEKILNFKMRSDKADGDVDKESSFYILSKTICPAILTENLFMDRWEDCRFLMSENGRRLIAGLHINAIKRIFYEFKQA